MSLSFSFSHLPGSLSCEILIAGGCMVDERLSSMSCWALARFVHLALVFFFDLSAEHGMASRSHPQRQ